MIVNANSAGSGCIAALEAEKYIAESASPEAEESKPHFDVDRSAVQPAAQEVGGQTRKDSRGAVAEYKSNPLL